MTLMGESGLEHAGLVFDTRGGLSHFHRLPLGIQRLHDGKVFLGVVPLHSMGGETSGHRSELAAEVELFQGFVAHEGTLVFE